MIVRPYTDRDLSGVLDVFTASVHHSTEGYYDAAQREAWAPRPPDPAAWRKRLRGLQTLIAEEEGGRLIGFVSWEPIGRIALLYTLPVFQRRGVATSLYGAAEASLLALGIREFHTEASSIARGFFESRGFRCEAEQEVRRQGIGLRRFLMRKTFPALPSAP